jgi:hypothetical protein
MFSRHLRLEKDTEEHSAMTSCITTIIRTLILLVLLSTTHLIAGGAGTDRLLSRQEVNPSAPGDSTAGSTATKRASRHKTSKNTEVQELSIQAGAFSLQKNADRLQQKLRAAGYRTDVYKNYLTANKLYYLVWVGSYQTEEEARPILASLKEKFNIDGVLRLRSILRH